MPRLLDRLRGLHNSGHQFHSKRSTSGDGSLKPADNERHSGLSGEGSRSSGIHRKMEPSCVIQIVLSSLCIGKVVGTHRQNLRNSTLAECNLPAGYSDSKESSPQKSANLCLRHCFMCHACSSGQACLLQTTHRYHFIKSVLSLGRVARPTCGRVVVQLHDNKKPRHARALFNRDFATL